MAMTPRWAAVVRAFIPLFLTFALVVTSAVMAACTEGPIHASLLTPTPGDGASPTPDPLENAAWAAPVELDEAWVTADTDLNLRVQNVSGDRFEAYLQHTGGELRAGGVLIPPDTWLLMDGYLVDDRRRIRLEATEAGHTLVYDADVLDHSRRLSGYFIVDDEAEVYQAMDRSGGL